MGNEQQSPERANIISQFFKVFSFFTLIQQSIARACDEHTSAPQLSAQSKVLPRDVMWCAHTQARATPRMMGQTQIFEALTPLFFSAIKA